MDSSLMTEEDTLQPEFEAQLLSDEEKSGNLDELQEMVRRCVTGEPPLRRVAVCRCVKVGDDPTPKRKRRLGRTTRHRRTRRLSFPDSAQSDKYRQRLRSHSRGIENSRGSTSGTQVMQWEYWSLPSMSDL